MAKRSRIARTTPWHLCAAATLGLCLMSLVACDRGQEDTTAPIVAQGVSEPQTAPNAKPAAGVEAVDLVPGQAQKRELADGERHAYRLVLEADQYLHLEVDQQGVDVVVTLFSPEGEQLLEVDGLNGVAGPERILWLTEASGDYRLEVGALAAAGPYTVWLKELRIATEEDRKRAAAAGVFAEGEMLRAKNPHQAVRKYEDALARWEQLDDGYWQGVTLHNLGYVYLIKLREQQKALEFYRRALPLVADNGGLEAVTLENLGVIYLRRNELEKALDHSHRALALWLKVGDRRGETEMGNNLGLLYAWLGEVHEALTYFAQALRGCRELGDLFLEARIHHNRGKCYSSMGKRELALDDLNRALAIRRKIDERPGQASTLTGIGQVYLQSGKLDKALEYLQQALELRDDDRRGEAVTLADIGSVHFESGNKEKAFACFQKSLKIFHELGARRSEAAVLRKLGWFYDASGEPERALEYYHKALSFSRKVGDRNGEAATLLGMAGAERQRSELERARNHIEHALDMIEDLRTKPASDDLRSAYFATKQNYYDFYVDLLMELHRLHPAAGHDAEALAASERARARSLLDTLLESGADLRRGADQTLLRREQELERAINARGLRRKRLLAGASPAGQVAAERELQDLLREYDRVRAGIRVSNPRYAALTQPRPLSAVEIQTRVLDGETLLLEYHLGEKRSFLWAVTSDSMTSFELPEQARIENTARLAHDLLTVSHKRRFRGQTERVLAALSDMLLGPVAEQLGNKRLLIVSEGVLQYIPFAALPIPVPSGNRAEPTPLGVENEIVSMPSVSTLEVLRSQLAEREPPPGMLAVLADPVFQSEDPRVRASRDASSSGESSARSRSEHPPSEEQRVERLPFSREEAEGILALVPATEMSFKALGFDANKQTATSDELGRYRIVHFATHGNLNTEFPELSGLVLSLVDPQGRSQDGFLRTHEIYKLNLTADLVVLSACQTALGEEIRGEGLVGLTRGFMYSGAAQVVISLWNVNDEATAELMIHFYRHMLGESRLRPAAALSAAQASIREDPRWQAPYFWAGFVIQGEWYPGHP